MRKKSHKNFLRKILLWTPKNSNRKPRYIGLAILVLSSIWLACFGFLKIAKPTYKSHWTLVLPGKGVGSNVSLIDIGQTSTAAASPYSNSSTSPKANYKEFAMSHAVRKSAAKKLSMTVSQFGKPRIKLVDQTSLIYFSITGNTPIAAQQKANALHQALLELLSQLRKDELYQHEGGVLATLDIFRKKLNLASDALIKFQSKSNLVSMAQFNEVVLTIEQLRREKINSLAKLKEIEGKATRLQSNLGISAKQASDSLILQNDSVYQEGVAAFTKAQQRLLSSQSKWGINHPEVRKSIAHYTQLNQSLSTRFGQLIKTSNAKNRRLLQLKGDSTRNKLMQDLIDFDVFRYGLKRKVNELEKLIIQLIKERNRLTLPASRLDDLIREHQVAEAIFTSALARTDTSKSDVFVSYPLLQILDKPSLPDKPSSPNRLFVVMGGVMSSIFTIIGLILLWLRKPYIQRILKSK